MNSIYSLVSSKNSFLSKKKITKFIERFIKNEDYKNLKVLLIIPDSTRSGPFGFLVKTILKYLKPICSKVDILIALGTHPKMSKEKINEFLDISSKDKDLFKNVKIFNHEWNNKDKLKKIGTLTKDLVRKISNNLLNESVDISINRIVFNYDKILVIGPVFPHEVVGFSGGWKYFFPGICGENFIHLFHWLGALITNLKINGKIDTPVRTLIHEAAKYVKISTKLLALDVSEKKITAIFAGDMIKAWYMAAKRSEKTHIIYLNRKYNRVVGIAPSMYDDLWTAGKVMYKLESIVKDCGELIIYAPRIKEISYTHGRILKKIGYHVRDYFIKNWKRFKNIPKGILAHSTHVKGQGCFDKVEKPRINVILATKISEKICKKVNLGYLDPDSLDWKKLKNNPDTLIVDNAGETLYLYRKKG